MNSTLKSLLFWMVLVVVGVLIWNFSTKFQHARRGPSRSASSCRGRLRAASRASTITGQEITGVTKANEHFQTYAPAQYEGLVNKLIERGVNVTAKEPTASPWASLLLFLGARSC